jgi:hypothetical protein
MPVISKSKRQALYCREGIRAIGRKKGCCSGFCRTNGSAGGLPSSTPVVRRVWSRRVDEKKNAVTKKCGWAKVGGRLTCPGVSPGAPRRQYPHLRRDRRRPAMRHKGGRCADPCRPDSRDDGDNLGNLLTWPARYVKLVKLADTWAECRLRALCGCCRSRLRHGLRDVQTPREAGPEPSHGCVHPRISSDRGE